jgi:hypothetical protein
LCCDTIRKCIFCILISQAKKQSRQARQSHYWQSKGKTKILKRPPEKALLKKEAGPRETHPQPFTLPPCTRHSFSLSLPPSAFAFPPTMHRSKKEKRKDSQRKHY